MKGRGEDNPMRSRKISCTAPPFPNIRQTILDTTLHNFRPSPAFTGRMNRNRWLLLAVVFLLVGKVAWTIYSRWGLITVHANAQPLSEVMRSIGRQGGVTLRTNLDANTPVTMNVTRVPLAEALETLAAVTESRWRLAYLLAPSRIDINNALGSFAAGERAEGWKTLDVPLRMFEGDDWTPPDPRQDRWNVKPVAETTAQAYLTQASRSVSARFMFPEDWNPAVASKLSSGPVRKVVPKLAKLAHAQEQEVFLLMKTRRGLAGDDHPAREFDREAMEERLQAELEKMPADRRAAAQAELDERKQFYASLANLSDGDRRARLEDYAQQPAVQDQNDQRQLGHDSRLSPEQRLARAQNYAQRRQDIRSGGGAQ
jgi:hypothetical protein